MNTSPQLRNLTRYTYLKTSFQGWRLSFSRRHRQFVRYFSDKACGGEEASLSAALQMRERILAELEASPDKVDDIFARYSLPGDPNDRRKRPIPRGRRRRKKSE